MEKIIIVKIVLQSGVRPTTDSLLRSIKDLTGVKSVELKDEKYAIQV